ncbi:cytochrome P450, family 79, subfamily B, polypeptide 2 [Actinidia rufa]|uniref:Cytochrome P450, family 79, subfamily B, polypeptide 2 n=1 Tax=Actinidia rufa TaxID=165716 RepID=A0A7J0HB38_9ERIC|nr:cytochrome P450, family 79, subfamily B, polypeptide 2 [Actinidia rufa]
METIHCEIFSTTIPTITGYSPDGNLPNYVSYISEISFHTHPSEDHAVTHGHGRPLIARGLVPRRSSNIDCWLLVQISTTTHTKHDTVFSSKPVCLSAELTSRGYLTTALTPLGDHWKKMRRVLASDILSPERHRWLARKRAEEADHLMGYIFNQNDGVVNVRVATQHYWGNVIRKMTFGKSFFRGWEGGWGRVDLDGHEGIMRWAIESVTKYQDPKVDERIRQWNEGTKMEQEDLLDVLIMLKDKDGVDVSGSGQPVERRGVGPGRDDKPARNPSTGHIRIGPSGRKTQNGPRIRPPNLNYLKACVRESFRLHPIAPFNLPHVSVSDATVAGYFIPKGSHVLLSRPGLGRNPRAWAEPLRIGRRGYAGVTLGSTMTVMLMARLLHCFTWELPSDVSKIELKESDGDLFLAKPLLALPRPRLDENLHLSL